MGKSTLFSRYVLWAVTRAATRAMLQQVKLKLIHFALLESFVFVRGMFSLLNSNPVVGSSLVLGQVVEQRPTETRWLAAAASRSGNPGEFTGRERRQRAVVGCAGPPGGLGSSPGVHLASRVERRLGCLYWALFTTAGAVEICETPLCFQWSRWRSIYTTPAAICFL